MPKVNPFPGVCPDPALAAEVIAPPYDVIHRDEACEWVASRRYSFLHVSRPEIDLSPDTPATDPAVYRRGAQTFNDWLREGILRQDEHDHFYAYRMQVPGHTQTGIMAVVAIADYLANRVRRHELTRPDKEDDRVRHMEALGAQTGPALLAYRDDPAVATWLHRATAGDPDYSSLPLGEVRHSLWRVSEPGAVAELQSIFARMPAVYIADGHHRTAAAARVAQARGSDPGDAAGGFLAGLFPASEMRILDYNRVVRDLNGLPLDGFLAAVARNFDVRVETAPVRPRAQGEFGMYLAGRWYRLHCHVPGSDNGDPLQRLDVNLLSTYLLEPVLGIGDPRLDPRIEFVGGGRGLTALQRHVDSGEMAVAFCLHPTPMQDLLAVADAGAIMPPKSTWFEPKLVDGLVSHLIGHAPG